MEERLHATTVAIDGLAVVLIGPSGSGKSDLALRLIDRGAVLVSDDQTLFRGIDGVVIASAPTTIAGKIEVRGLGIVEISQAGDAPAALVVRLGGTVARMPLEDATMTVAGIALPAVALDAFEGSAAIKVELALRRVREAT